MFNLSVTGFIKSSMKIGLHHALVVERRKITAFLQSQTNLNKYKTAPTNHLNIKELYCE